MAAEYLFVDERDVNAPRERVFDARTYPEWWTPISETGDTVHVRFDWRVFADRALLRCLTPVLHP